MVKSYLKRGSSLAVIAERNGKYEIVAETPPLGAPHRWLNPAGIADFNGDGKTDIALVRQPHVVGALELWSWRDGHLRKAAELADVANHIAGTRALDMAAAADFDGDGIADLAVPSFDRSRCASSASRRSRARSPASRCRPRRHQSRVDRGRLRTAGDRARPRRRLAGRDPALVNRQIFQQRQHADNDDDHAHDLFGAAIDRQHVDR